MINTIEDLLNIRSNKLYLYGAKSVALQVCSILKEHDIHFEGYIVSKLDDNRSYIDGKPVVSLDSLKDSFDDIDILVCCLPHFKKEIMNSLLNAGVSKIYFLGNDLAYTFSIQMKAKSLFNNYTEDYELVYPDGLERGQGLIVGRKETASFKLRTELGWLNRLIESNSELFKGNRLKENFEELWCRFKTIYELKSAEKKINISDCFSVYSIKCHVDKTLFCQTHDSYITEIQAGAAIAPKIICDVTDNTGDNISERNKDFSECSAFYWIWKNSVEKKYTGCFHYRRRLNIFEDDLNAVVDNDIDLVNTIPCILYPSIKNFFITNFLYDKDWSLMMEAISSLHPEYLDSTIKLADGNYYLANNIMIMKTCWYEKMCQFVFDVLLYIDNYYRDHNFVRQDRYAGYIFEFLYSAFVFHHVKDMKIVFADMKFLV